MAVALLYSAFIVSVPEITLVARGLPRLVLVCVFWAQRARGSVDRVGPVLARWAILAYVRAVKFRGSFSQWTFLTVLFGLIVFQSHRSPTWAAF